MTEREVSSERVSGELRDAIAAIIAGNVDESRFYSAPTFQRAATEVILALRSPATPSEVTEAMVERFRAFVKEATGTELSLQIVERALTAALKGDRP